ncbi:MAG: exosortase A [Rhodocyclaceae bacterium]
MKAEAEPLLAAAAASDAVRVWRACGALMLALGFWLIAWYGETSSSIEAIWSRSETFAHGYLVLPVFAWLVWRIRARIVQPAPRPFWPGLAVLAAIGFGWLAARMGQVQVVQHFALAAMIPALVLTVLGARVARAIAFPLAFLFLGVPFGEAFIPPLMLFTADFTVAMLQLTGIPVLREGLFFTIPSGQWSVVEGCSGLRYLISSIFAGTLYAYLNYTSLRKRALFIAASVVVPILANGMRAYLIVMIAHLSDQRLAHGIDHFIYGWVWFGIVILTMFWIGARWRDPEPKPMDVAARELPQPGTLAAVLLAAVAAVAALGIWPVWAAHLDGARRVPPAKFEVPEGLNGWTREGAALTEWRPQYRGADATGIATYRKGDRAVALHVHYYRGQRQDAELINSQNMMIRQKHPVWRNVGEARRSERLASGDLDVRRTLLSSEGQRLLVWDWFYLDGRRTVDPYLAKMLLARDRMLGRPDDGAAIILAAAYEHGTEAAEESLRAFAADMLPAIEEAIRRTERQ